jgi:hypothetical protein
MRMWRNWQTRMIQVHVPEMAWRFKSSHPHQNRGSRKRLTQETKISAVDLLLFTQALEAESLSDDDPRPLGIRDNFAEHSGDQAATDSTKDSKQEKLTEKNAGE